MRESGEMINEAQGILYDALMDAFNQEGEISEHQLREILTDAI